MNTALRNPRLVIPALAVGILLLSVALPVFQPWRLFTSTTVIESVPVATSTGPAPGAPAPSGSPAGPVVLAAGRFVSHEHRTTGTVRLIRLVDGSALVRLERLDTSGGPDLHGSASPSALRRSPLQL